MKTIMGMLMVLSIISVGCSKSEAADQPAGDHHECGCTDQKSKESLFYGTFCPEKTADGKYYLSRGHYRDTVDGRDKSICFTVEHKCSCPAPKE